MNPCRHATRLSPPCQHFARRHSKIPCASSFPAARRSVLPAFPDARWPCGDRRQNPFGKGQFAPPFPMKSGAFAAANRPARNWTRHIPPDKIITRRASERRNLFERRRVPPNAVGFRRNGKTTCERKRRGRQNQQTDDFRGGARCRFQVGRTGRKTRTFHASQDANFGALRIRCTADRLRRRQNDPDDQADPKKSGRIGPASKLLSSRSGEGENR